MKTLKEANKFLWKFGLFKVPMIFFLRPKVIELDDDHAVVKIRLSRRAKNHLNSMYFGALCVGADITGGILLVKYMAEHKTNFSFVFKDVKGEFLKRPEADVHFTCNDGAAIRELITKALTSGARENLPVTIKATSPSMSGEEPVAQFILTLSIKKV